MKRTSFIATGLAIASLSTAAAFAVGLEARQELPAGVGDLAAARLVEVTDESGTVLFSGQLGETVESGGERERKAMLIGSGGATCEAEVELATGPDGRVQQELEVDVEGAPASVALRVSIDGRHVASFTTDAKGEAEVELSGAAGR